MEFLIAAISGQGLVEAVVWLIVIGIVFWVLWWGLGKIGLPEPFNKVATVVLILAAVLVVCNILLGLVGHPLIKW